MRLKNIATTTLSVFLLMAGLSVAGLGQDSPTPSTDAPPAHDPRLEEIREFVIDEIAGGSVPSLSLAVALDGRVVWEEAFGLADVERGVPATPNTLYRSGSIAKPITATAVMQLVEAGLVDLDAPLEQYLGDLKLHYYASSPENVTVRRVLQHRAGFPPHNQFLFRDEEPHRRPFSETVRRYGNVMFWPGSYIYSNIGYQLLAHVVAQVSGQDFPGYVRDRVFIPLGMSTAQVYVGDDILNPAVRVYPGSYGDPIPDFLSPYPGSADVYFSGPDLLRFAMFHLKNGLPDQVSILADSTIEAMQRNDPPVNDRYGLGWYCDIDDRGYRSTYHGGDEPGVNNFMVMVPSENLAIVILANCDYPPERLLHIQGAVRAALISGYEGVNPWALAVEDSPEAGADAATADATEAPQAQQFPEELRGTWAGRIVAYDREIALTLVIADEGARIRLTGQEECSVDFQVVTPGFVLGTFAGRIPTPDAARYETSIRLAMVRNEDTLSGQATAVGWREDRQSACELSSWIELTRE